MYDNHTAYKTTTAPTAEPVTLAEAKHQVRVEDTFTDDDGLLTALIIAAREFCSQYQARAYITQTITLKMDRFPRIIRVPRSPLIAVSSINYTDVNGDDQLLSTDIYDVDTTSEPGLITLKYNQSWPAIQTIHHAVTVVYTAGYGAAAADVPQSVKQAMLLLIAHWYEHRYDVCDVQMYPIPEGAKSLLGDRCFL